MKIATYNVRVDTDYDQDWQWSFRKNQVIDLMRYHHWDLFGVQEVRPNQVADLNALSDYTCLSAERDGDGQGEGIALLFQTAKFSVADHGFFWLSETPSVPSIHQGAAYARVALWAILTDKLSGGQFLVVNTHLDHISEEARVLGMQVIFEQLQAQIAAYPVILMGDFNAYPDERVHALIKQHLVNGKTLSTGHHYGPDATFQDFNYDVAWENAEEIDYIYLKDFTVTGTAVVTDSCDRRFPSDHFPLEMTIN